MASPKSPFYVTQNFISPKLCEQLVCDLEFIEPDTDKDGNPIKMSRHWDPGEKAVFDRFISLIPHLEKYYEYEHRGTTPMSFEVYAQGTQSEHICESCNWIRNSWVRTKDRDFTCILFLSNYQNKPNFEEDFEVYGGKVEFPQHKFSFNPQRGTLIVYPSGPHFINAVSPIIEGDLFMVKWHLCAKLPYLYDPSKFPGDYTTWFQDIT